MVGNKDLNIFNEDSLKKAYWLNNKKIREENLKKKKPCYILGYCPYGGIVEAFKLRNEPHPIVSCGIFGHDCPMFYNAEDMSELGDFKLKKEII